MSRIGPKRSKLMTRSVSGIGKLSELHGGMSVSAQIGAWGKSHIGFERFETVGFEMREREGWFKCLLGKEKVACN